MRDLLRQHADPDVGCMLGLPVLRLLNTCMAARRYEQMFDIPYALPKLDIVALPHFVFQAMENWVRPNQALPSLSAQSQHHWQQKAEKEHAMLMCLQLSEMAHTQTQGLIVFEQTRIEIPPGTSPYSERCLIAQAAWHACTSCCLVVASASTSLRTLTNNSCFTSACRYFLVADTLAHELSHQVRNWSEAGSLAPCMQAPSASPACTSLLLERMQQGCLMRHNMAPKHDCLMRRSGAATW